MLTRSYNDEIGASWQETFGTEDRAAVENYRHANGIEFSWHPTVSCAPGSAAAPWSTHPATGQRCWFNQVAFLNQWTLDPDVRDYLVDVYGDDGLPFNTRFGNGDPIGEDVVDAAERDVRGAHLREPWQAGDLLLVDNIRTAHSREAFDGRARGAGRHGRPGATVRLRRDGGRLMTTTDSRTRPRCAAEDHRAGSP